MIKRSLKWPILMGVGIVAGVIWCLQRIFPKCSCDCESSNWSSVFTMNHPEYYNEQVTYVICLKHAAVRLYDDEEMRILSAAEDRQIRKAILHKHQHPEEIQHDMAFAASVSRL